MRLYLLTIVILIGCGRSEPVAFGGKPITHWIEELQKPEPQARKKAVAALGSAAIASAEARTALLSAIGDTDPDVRYSVCIALVNLGPAAGSDASAALEPVLNDPDKRVREAAAAAKKRIHGQIE